MNRLHTLIFLLIVCLSARGELHIYPAGVGVETLSDYNVKVRTLPDGEWQDISVYPVRVDEVKDAKHNAKTASMAYFDFDGEVEVKVVLNYTNFENAKIRPLSYEIPYTRDCDTICFQLTSPANLSVEINGDIFRNLHLFANPIDRNRPTEQEIASGKVIYFAPGLHNIEGGGLRIPSNTKVYVDGGAFVNGKFIVENVENVKIQGRGEIRPDIQKDGNASIYVNNSKNVEADGVIVSQMPVGGSDSVKISNVKSISHYGWGDGMNVFASDNVEYDRVFCRNSDDCHTVYGTRKGFVGGCKNITMKNSTLWADVAHPFMIGLHGSAKELGLEAPPDTISNLRYENIDILDHAEKQLDYQGCFGINCGDNNIVENITFDNIRVEDFRQGQLFNVRIFFNKKYCAAPGLGVRNILFKDIQYNGNNSEVSIIMGYDEDRKVENVVFENLMINGVKISDDMEGKPAWYKTGDMARIFIGEHVDNIVFK